MAVREILLLGNPILRKIASPVGPQEKDSVISIAGDLRDTLIDFRSKHGTGRGIAAPQISQSKRIIYLDAGEATAMLNPEIVAASTEMMTLWDDCFSLPGLMVKVRRHKSVKVRYHDLRWEEKVASFDGSASELLQHEIDHLDGILSVDRAVDSKHIWLRSEYDKLRPGTGAIMHPL